MTLEEDTSCLQPGDLVDKLESFMTDEFEKLGTRSDEFSYENFLVYKEAFSHIINHSVLMKDKLANFKYVLDEEIMNAHRKLEQMKCQLDPCIASELSQATQDTIKLRKKELLLKYEKVDKENRKLQCGIENTKALIEDAKKVEIVEEYDPYKSKLIEGFSLDQMTNINFLSRELGKMDSQYQSELGYLTTKFVSKQKYIDLQNILNRKEEKKVKMLAEIERTGKSCVAMKIFTDKMASFQELGEEITAEMVDKEIQNALAYAKEHSISSIDFLDEDDSLKEEEAELYVAYIEHFEELIRDEKYGQAALLAATSPNGFLRTMPTMRIFKNVETDDNIEVNPLLYYVTLLMRTADQYSIPPPDQSYESVSCAVTVCRYDYIAQWVANGTISFTTEIAELLLRSCYCRLWCDCEAGTLAQSVYREIGDYGMVAFCLAKQGSLYRAINVIKAAGLGENALYQLLNTVPSLDLASLLVLEEGLSLGQVLKSLFDNHNDSLCIGLLRVIHESGDLRQVLTASPYSEISWNNVITLCSQLGEDEIVLEIQAYVLSWEAITRAIESELLPEEQ